MVDIMQSVSVVYSSLEYGDIKARFADDKTHLTLGEGHTAPSGPFHFTTRAFARADDPDEDHWLWCFPFVKSEGKRSRSLSVRVGECPDHPDTDGLYSVQLIKEDATWHSI